MTESKSNPNAKSIAGTAENKFVLGDDIFNSDLNRMGSYRATNSSGIVLVRTVNGLEEWPAGDCEKFDDGDSE